jgi:hypothetical protein
LSFIGTHFLGRATGLQSEAQLLRGSVALGKISRHHRPRAGDLDA